MTSYNYKFVSALVAFSALLNGCVNRDPHVTKNGASFFVDAVKSDITPNQLNASDDVNQKFANISACLKDNAQTAVIMNIPFTIQAGNVSFTKTTDDQGCLIWQELFEYDPKDHEKQIAITRTITAVQGHTGSVDMQLVYNPWKEPSLTYLRNGLRAQGAENVSTVYTTGDKLSHKDFVNGTEVNSHVDVKAKFASQTRKALDVSSLTMRFIKRDFDNYKITPALDLSIAHLYRVRFNSFVVRHTLDHGMVLDALSAGRFRFYFVLLREGYNNKDVPASDVSKYVVASSTFDSAGSLGRFVTDISLRFDNIAALANRMTGIIAMEPIDQPDTYLTSNFEGIISPIGGSAGQSLDLVPSELNAKKLAQDYDAARANRMKTTGLGLLEKQGRFKKLEMPLTNGSSANFAAFFAAKKASPTFTVQDQTTYGKALCFAYFDRAYDAAKIPVITPAATACNENSMNATIREFVVQTNSQTPVQDGPPEVETLAISNAFTFDTDHTVIGGKSAKVDGNAYANVGIGFDILKIFSRISSLVGITPTAEFGFKISANGDIYKSTTAEQKVEKDTSTVATRSESITSEGFKFRLDVTTKTCLFITPTTEFSKAYKNLGLYEGRYFCEDQASRKFLEEKYYFVNQSTGSATSPLSDNLSGQDNPWRMFIRGSQTYRLFTSIFNTKNVSMTFEKMPDKDLLNTLNNAVNQEFPGMIMSGQ